MRLQTSFSVLIFSAALLLAACGDRTEQTNQSPTATVTPTETTAPPSPTFTPTTLSPSATPTTTPSPAPSATSIPQPTPLSAATLPPSPASPAPLSEADQLLRNGDYAAAASTYSAYLAAQPDAAQAAEASLRLGQAYWLDGRADAAIEALAPLADNADAIARYPEALYWLGRAQAALGQAEQAAASFEAFANLRPALADRALLAGGDAFAAALDWPNAQGAYERALAAAPDVRAALRVRERLAEAKLSAGDANGAVEQYQLILADAQNASYRAEMLYLLGRAQAAAGDAAGAIETYRQATAANPESAFAYRALIELVAAGQSVDDLARGRIDFHASAYAQALEALFRYLDVAPDHDGEAHALAARSYEAQGNYALADREWQSLIDTHPNDALVGTAWLGRGRSLWRQGDTAGARAVYLEASERSPDRTAAADALWWAAVIAEQSDDLATAASDLRRLAESFPESNYAAQALFRAGLAHYRMGDIATALERWAALAGAGRSLWNAAADFWQGKALAANGDAAAAQEQWRGVVERWGVDNFYGLRAAHSYEAATGESLLAAAPGATDGDAIDALAGWLQGWATSDAIDLRATPSEFARADELWRMGELSEAGTIFESLRQSWTQDAVRLTQLALHTRDRGYYDTSIRAAARVAALSGQPLVSTPTALQQLIYPTYYADLIVPAAQRYGIEPALLFALVRQESLFGSSATSGAAARGLTQVIPPTGESIAAQLNWPNYRTELLYRPYVSVAFGAFYLAQGLERARGNIWNALAGYNGGPGNASFWQQLAGDDEDLYVEVVGFTETQTYLRTIAVQAEHYRRLYPDLANPTP